MNWGGGDDICLFNDLTTMKQYVMYEKANEDCATLSEFTCFPSLAISNPKRLPFKKKDLAQAFINDSFLYIGHELHTNKIDRVFDLLTNKFHEIPCLYFTDKCYYIYQMTYFPSDSFFIISDPNTLIRFHAGI